MPSQESAPPSSAYLLLSAGSAPSTANPYPSQIQVNPEPVTRFTEDSRITDVEVVLNSVSLTLPDDLDVLLVGPHEQSTILMSDAGGSTAVNNIFLWFTNEKQRKLPDADTFPDPANPGEALTLGKKVNFSVFNGTNPIGAWKLYVVDDAENEAGFISGWTLHIRARG